MLCQVNTEDDTARVSFEEYAQDLRVSQEIRM